MRRMYDSVNWEAIPLDSDLVAGYKDGRYQWPLEAWNRFTGKTLVTIAAAGNTAAIAHVADVEQGDYTPETALEWVRQMRLIFFTPTLYCNRSTLAEIRAVFAAAGEPEPQYWIADPDDGPNLYPGSVATQYGYEGSYDVSIVEDHWEGVDPATPPPAPGPPQPDGPVVGVAANEVGYGFWIAFADGSVWTMDSAPFYGSYQSLPPDERQAPPDFVGIVARDGGGYCLVHRAVQPNGSGIYRFGPGLNGF